MTDTQADALGKITIVLSEDAVYPSDCIDPDAPQNEIVIERFIVTGSEQILVSINLTKGRRFPVRCLFNSYGGTKIECQQLKA
ncbi:hypothetical protein F4Z98_06125 [Candidatus Poribacteria bacterium]|nr:hypothetical protein [Candidatus Poribacteria bacterium]MYB01743.1 hypothetical protein [Candidatus Poribacteria bacterium]